MHLPKSAPIEREFLVVCLCAAWCGTCREYEEGFRELEGRYSEIGFVWVDIEDENSGVEDWDVENFPTVVIQRGELVLFFGPLLPHLSILRKMIDTFAQQSQDQARIYAHGTPERASWQSRFSYRSIAAKVRR
jgi:thioredoxin 1